MPWYGWVLMAGGWFLSGALLGTFVGAASADQERMRLRELGERDPF